MWNKKPGQGTPAGLTSNPKLNYIKSSAFYCGKLGHSSCCGVLKMQRFSQIILCFLLIKA